MFTWVSKTFVEGSSPSAPASRASFVRDWLFSLGISESFGSTLTAEFQSSASCRNSARYRTTSLIQSFPNICALVKSADRGAWFYTKERLSLGEDKRSHIVSQQGRFRRILSVRECSWSMQTKQSQNQWSRIRGQHNSACRVFCAMESLHGQS